MNINITIPASMGTMAIDRINIERRKHASVKRSQNVPRHNVIHSSAESRRGRRYHWTPKNSLAEAGLPRADPPCRPPAIDMRAY